MSTTTKPSTSLVIDLSSVMQQSSQHIGSSLPKPPTSTSSSAQAVHVLGPWSLLSFAIQPSRPILLRPVQAIHVLSTSSVIVLGRPHVSGGDLKEGKAEI
ncbi:hypothetical protein THAOC_13140 [Thalassiosira oceanica]|uniref:Uncharacterized protein n=1 Tax=Thalassiosira oceanica TaxID=159749 RepID=K0SKV3_THAOC|nr:hypothetical protein THAOC_13140 [Thalassiosira oceanica]|eukprot:EJK65960.1 hypothetical protein THAOC_13140 [Thalassiosira oceanica]